MPVVHEQNYSSRVNNTDKIDQRAASRANLAFNDSADPPKQPDIQQQVQPIAMKKRVGRDPPEFAVQLAGIWERAEFQQRRFVFNAVGRELDSKTDQDRDDQPNSAS